MQQIILSNSEITRVFFTILLLLTFSQVFGYIFWRFSMPKVIGEIFGGFLLGPSCLGHISPELFKWLFNSFPGQGKILSMIYWFGLVFLMFISGFEVKGSIFKGNFKFIIALIIGATVLPLIAGWGAPYLYDFAPFIGTKENILSLKIIIAISVAVTSIPVISKIFIDLNIINTRFSKIVISAATLQDILLWIALSIATGLVEQKVMNGFFIFSKILITILFFFFAVVVSPYLYRFLNSFRFNLLKKSSNMSYILVICFLFAAVASVLEVNVVFGAFLAGILVSLNDEQEFEKAKDHVKQLGVSFLVPMYFAIVGLKLNILKSFNFEFFVFFLFFSTFFELVGVMTFLTLIKTKLRTSFNFAMAMNTRGGPGIVLATIAFDLGIINEVFFVTLVLTAIVTSLASGWWFRFLQNKKIPLME
tara:strand:+ start:48025 stop:49284 length:1260 start_codon:yes stop_codon:yes gene_type:complete